MLTQTACQPVYPLFSQVAGRKVLRPPLYLSSPLGSDLSRLYCFSVSLFLSSAQLYVEQRRYVVPLLLFFQ